MWRFSVWRFSESMSMNAVYVVVENSQPYKVAYASFESAAAVKEKHKEEVEAQMLEACGGTIFTELP
uniref:Uncharacterized protein n=1 Tax=viral metagenome TaxID=1070528 RepID=A0A6C0K671_9ZZZZ